MSTTAVTTQIPSTSNSATSNSTSSSSGASMDTTFLQILCTELQCQDPTSPVDPTQMVGQMISLNQLDQLISINQNTTPTTGGN